MQAAELVSSAVSYRPATRCRSYRLPVPTTAVSTTAAMRCATGMSTTTAAAIAAATIAAATTAIASAATIAAATAIASGAIAATTAIASGAIAATTAIASAATTVKAMAAPAVSIAPVGPGAHAQEDSVVEISRSVKSHRRAGVGRIVIVAVRTDGLSTDIDDNLRPGRWRQAKAQTCEQCCSTEKSFESAHI